MQGAYSHFINFIVKHVNQEIQALLPHLSDLFSEVTYRFDSSYPHVHRVIFKHQ